MGQKICNRKFATFLAPFSGQLYQNAPLSDISPFGGSFTESPSAKKQVDYTHWHVSKVVYKWRHLADCKLLQFIKQQKIYLVNKHACVTNFLAEKQQMALVVCRSVFSSNLWTLLKKVSFLETVGAALEIGLSLKLNYHYQVH